MKPALLILQLIQGAFADGSSTAAPAPDLGALPVFANAEGDGQHCWWESPWCDPYHHTLLVWCVQWINGFPNYYTMVVGSC